jgi:hypothetical protein
VESLKPTEAIALHQILPLEIGQSTIRQRRDAEIPIQTVDIDTDGGICANRANCQAFGVRQAESQIRTGAPCRDFRTAVDALFKMPRFGPNIAVFRKNIANQGMRNTIKMPMPLEAK